MSEVETKIIETNITEANTMPVVKSNLGGKRPGAGRPVGPRKQKQWKMVEELATKYQQSPLDYMLSVLNCPKTSPERKLYAAEKAAPFVHPKLSNSVSRVGYDGRINIKVKWEE
jgi:hypothetical protein